MAIRPQRLKRPWMPKSSSGIANRVRDPFYHTNAWRKASERFLADNPLCRKCQEKGMLEPSKITDHIIPKDICDDPWNEENWQPICRKCHSEKSARDKSKFLKI